MRVKAEADVLLRVTEAKTLPQFKRVLDGAAKHAVRLYDFCRRNDTGKLEFESRAGSITFVPLRKEKKIPHDTSYQSFD